MPSRHPDLLPGYRERVERALADPDRVRRSLRMASARLFSRWFGDIMGGKHVVAVVVSDSAPERHWLMTAYLASKLASGDIEWKRN